MNGNERPSSSSSSLYLLHKITYQDAYSFTYTDIYIDVAGNYNTHDARRYQSYSRTVTQQGEYAVSPSSTVIQKDSSSSYYLLLCLRAFITWRNHLVSLLTWIMSIYWPHVCRVCRITINYAPPGKNHFSTTCLVHHGIAIRLLLLSDMDRFWPEMLLEFFSHMFYSTSLAYGMVRTWNDTYGNGKAVGILLTKGSCQITPQYIWQTNRHFSDQ